MWSTCNLINTYIPQQSKYLQREISICDFINWWDDIFQKRDYYILIILSNYILALKKKHIDNQILKLQDKKQKFVE